MLLLFLLLCLLVLFLCFVAMGVWFLRSLSLLNLLVWFSIVLFSVFFFRSVPFRLEFGSLGGPIVRLWILDSGSELLGL